MAESALRLVLILQKIPQAPAKITLAEIRGYLASLFIKVSDRTIQRDLIQLSQHFPIQANENTRPYGWSYQQNDNSDLATLQQYEPVIQSQGSAQDKVKENEAQKVLLKCHKEVSDDIAAINEVEIKQITSINDHYAIISLLAYNSPTLKASLLSYGEKIEVLEPQTLRKTFTDIARTMSSMYQ